MRTPVELNVVDVLELLERKAIKDLSIDVNKLVQSDVTAILKLRHGYFEKVAIITSQFEPRKSMV